MDFIGAVAIALLLLVGRGQIQNRSMTEGQFFTFIVALFKLYDPVRKFALYYNSFQQAIGASSEIFRFMDDQDDLVEKPRAHHLKGFKDGYSTGECRLLLLDGRGRKTGAFRYQP